jgi:hypothetical protein
MVALGLLCLVAGIFDRRLGADECPNQEPDFQIYCPVQVGDNPNITCDDKGHTTPELCDGNRHASSFYTNYSYTKYSKDHFPRLQLDGFATPLTKPCYKRTYCKWKDGKCQDDKTEFVYQFVYAKAACTEGGPPGGGD